MKKCFKYLLITISLSFLTISNNVFAKNEEKNQIEDFSTYTVQCTSKNKNYENNEKYYENLGNLAVYSLLYEIPDISKETLKNIVLSWNNGYSRQYYLNTYTILNKDKKKIKNFYKDISEKIKKYEKNKNENDDLEKYIEKILEEKNINLNKLKNKYIKLIENIIKENEKEIEDLKKELKKSDNDKFFIEFAKKNIEEEKQKYKNRNIIEEIKFKNNKKLIENGKKRAEKKIKRIASTNEKLERNIKDTKKIKKSELNSILKGVFESNNTFFLNDYGNEYSLDIDFKNVSYNTDVINHLYSRHFLETLDKELEKQKENGCVKRAMKKAKKEYKDIIKRCQEDEETKNLDIEEIKKYSEYCKSSVISPELFVYSVRRGLNGSIYLYGLEKDLMEIISKIIKSDKFKEKLKKSLTKERFEKLKSELLENVKFTAKYTKMAEGKLIGKSALDLGEKDVKNDIKWQKENLENIKKQREDKYINKKRTIKNAEKTLKENEKKLKNKEELKEIGEERKENELDEYKYEKSQINYWLKQLKNAKFKDMQRAKDLIKYKKINLRQS